MGNELKALMELDDKSGGEEIEERLKSTLFTILPEEQKRELITKLKNEDFRNSTNEFISKLDEQNERISQTMASIPNLEPEVYEGSCGFHVDDPEGQRILDKYLPRKLNKHSKDILNLFSKTTFKELRESSDRYPETAFWSDPLNWIFLAKDQDFQDFWKITSGINDIEKIENFINDSGHNKIILREVVNYILLEND